MQDRLKSFSYVYMKSLYILPLSGSTELNTVWKCIIMRMLIQTYNFIVDPAKNPSYILNFYNNKNNSKESKNFKILGYFEQISYPNCIIDGSC